SFSDWLLHTQLSVPSVIASHCAQRCILSIDKYVYSGKIPARDFQRANHPSYLLCAPGKSRVLHESDKQHFNWITPHRGCHFQVMEFLLEACISLPAYRLPAL